MSCSPFDLKDYLFGELKPAESGQVESHVRECRPCREELERLRMTQAALHSLRDEEPPRRIAFVSDKVFEPRWWEVWWNSAPRLAFAGAAVLAAAILVHAFAKPGVVAAPSSPNSAAIEARIHAEVAQRIDSAVRAAVAQSEERQAKKASEMVEAVRRDLEFQRRSDEVRFEEAFTILQKKYNNVILASNEAGGRP